MTVEIEKIVLNQRFCLVEARFHSPARCVDCDVCSCGGHSACLHPASRPPHSSSRPTHCCLPVDVMFGDDANGRRETIVVLSCPRLNNYEKELLASECI
jgi:hypothetical protein